MNDAGEKAVRGEVPGHGKPHLSRAFGSWVCGYRRGSGMLGHGGTPWSAYASFQRRVSTWRPPQAAPGS